MKQEVYGIHLNKLNVAFLGIGGMGQLHLANCAFMGKMNIIAVADKSKNLLKKAELYKVKNFYEDYVELLDKENKNLDAVIISLPNYLHYDSVIRSLEYGLNVFVEKPLALSPKECKEIIISEEKSGKKIMVGYSMRYIDAIQLMKKKLEEGRLGNLTYLTLESIQNGPLSHGRVPKPVSEWWFNPKLSGGGALMDLGTHLIDLFHFFSGNAKVIFSKLDYKFNLPVEDGGTIILESIDSDVRAIINVGWFEKMIFPKFNFRVILHGTADYVSSEDYIPKNYYTYAIKEGIKNFSKRISVKKISPLSYTYWYTSYYKELEQFYNSIMNEEEILSNSNNGLKNIEIINAAYELNKKNRDDFVE